MSELASRLGRRRFLAGASACAAWAAFNGLHESFAANAQVAKPARDGGPRIFGLRLLTAAPLAQMKAFYRDTLGLPVVQEVEGSFTIRAGATEITFARALPDHGKPFYHFAFNIPENKIRGARTWQLERSELIPIFPRLRDPRYPDDVVHFRNWNAHSVFFFDPAGNVVEYIARHDLGNGAEGPFGTDDILYASEIGFVTDDVPTMAAQLQETLSLGSYRPGSEAFHPVGDEHGLLLVFARGRDLSFGAKERKLADVFPTAARLGAGIANRWAASDYPYTIVG